MLFVMMRIDFLFCFYCFTRYGNEPAMTQIKNDTYFYKVILHLGDLVDHGHDVILGGIQIPYYKGHWRYVVKSRDFRLVGYTNIRW